MAGPTIRRRQLGAALRQLRADADETREQTAFVLGCSPTKVTYLESGRNVIGKTELIVLLQHYDAGDKLDALEELRTEAGKRGWWSTARLPEWLAAYVGLETEASSVRSFELELIPGLLQTEAYARDLHVLRGALKPDDLERRVQARLRRQELGLHSGMSGAFTLLSFPDGLLPDAGWQEYALGGHIIDDDSDVATLTRLFDELRSQALGCDESLTLLAEIPEHTH
jgi:transcriptional regulator with XRE-family HTH domain